MSVISGRQDSIASREAASLSDHVPAATTEQVLTLTVERPATVERVALRIYQGAQLDLEIRPYIRRKNNTEQPLIELVGKEYIDGDDDLYVWDISRPLEDNEEIVFSATNNDGSNAYDYRVNLDLDYADGASRFLGGLF